MPHTIWFRFVTCLRNSGSCPAGAIMWFCHRCPMERSRLLVAWEICLVFSWNSVVRSLHPLLFLDLLSCFHGVCSFLSLVPHQSWHCCCSFRTNLNQWVFWAPLEEWRDTSHVRSHQAVSPSSSMVAVRVDFPTVTDLCERIQGDSTQMLGVAKVSCAVSGLGWPNHPVEGAAVSDHGVTVATHIEHTPDTSRTER